MKNSLKLAIGTKSASYSQVVEFIPSGDIVVVITTTRDEYAGGCAPYLKTTMPIVAAREEYKRLKTAGYR